MLQNHKSFCNKSVQVARVEYMRVYVEMSCFQTQRHFISLLSLIEMLCLGKIIFVFVCSTSACCQGFFSISIMFVFRLYNISFCIRLFNYGRHTTAVQENNKGIFTMWVKYMKRNIIFLFSSLLLSQKFPPGNRQKRSSVYCNVY